MRLTSTYEAMRGNMVIALIAVLFILAVVEARPDSNSDEEEDSMRIFADIEGISQEALLADMENHEPFPWRKDWPIWKTWDFLRKNGYDNHTLSTFDNETIAGLFEIGDLGRAVPHTARSRNPKEEPLKTAILISQHFHVLYSLHIHSEERLMIILNRWTECRSRLHTWDKTHWCRVNQHSRDFCAKAWLKTRRFVDSVNLLEKFMYLKVRHDKHLITDADLEYWPRWKMSKNNGLRNFVRLIFSDDPFA